MIAERRGILSGGQIDRLCQEWLRENCGEEIATEYTIYSLVIPMWNSPNLNDALEDLKWNYASPLVPSSPSEALIITKPEKS